MAETDNLDDSEKLVSYRERISLQAQQFMESAAAGGKLSFIEVINITIPEEGISTAVFMVDGLTSERKPVRRFVRVGGTILAAEAHFLKRWKREAGVDTPEVINYYSESPDGQHSILEEELFDCKSVSKLFPTREGKIPFYRRIGEILARMHRVKGEGYGRPCAENLSRGKYGNFTEQMESEVLSLGRRRLLLARQLITEKEISTARTAVVMIEKFIAQNEDVPVLTHGDLTTDNLLYGGEDRIIVVDPDPRVTFTYYDLAMSLLWRLEDEEKEIIDGYEITSGISVDREVLEATIFLAAFKKLYARVKRKDPRGVKRMQKILKESGQRLRNDVANPSQQP